MTSHDDLTTPAPSEADAGPTTLTRRRALTLLGIGSVGLLAACGSSSSSSSTTAAAGGTATTAGSGATTAGSSATTAAAAAAGTTAAAGATATTAAASGDLTATPSETGGPFPSDGSNDNGEGATANMLADSRTVRSDIRSDLDGSNTQEGVPLTLTMTVLDDATGAALQGAAVYIWHCNKEGVYSQYNSNMLGGDYTDRSYLRGVQLTDAAGNVTFRTILPGRYQGRAFHVHFEVFRDGTYADKLLTSQFGMDDDKIDALYAEAGYTSALEADTDNGDDGIFRDGYDHQLMTVAGSVSSGLTGTFTVVV